MVIEETTQEKILAVEIMTTWGEIQEMVIKETREIMTIILTGGEVETTQAKILEVILFDNYGGIHFLFRV